MQCEGSTSGSMMQCKSQRGGLGDGGEVDYRGKQLSERISSLVSSEYFITYRAGKLGGSTFEADLSFQLLSSGEIG